LVGFLDNTTSLIHCLIPHTVTEEEATVAPAGRFRESDPTPCRDLFHEEMKDPDGGPHGNQHSNRTDKQSKTEGDLQASRLSASLFVLLL